MALKVSDTMFKNVENQERKQDKLRRRQNFPEIQDKMISNFYSLLLQTLMQKILHVVQIHKNSILSTCNFPLIRIA